MCHQPGFLRGLQLRELQSGASLEWLVSQSQLNHVLSVTVFITYSHECGQNLIVLASGAQLRTLDVSSLAYYPFVWKVWGANPPGGSKSLRSKLMADFCFLWRKEGGKYKCMCSADGICTVWANAVCLKILHIEDFKFCIKCTLRSFSIWPDSGRTADHRNKEKDELLDRHEKCHVCEENDIVRM
jgi:hypothetical protein